MLDLLLHNDGLQWVAIFSLFLFTCFARGSAVDEARRYTLATLERYDENLAAAIRRRKP